MASPFCTLLYVHNSHKILHEAGLRAHREVPIPEFANVPRSAPVYDDDDIDPLELQKSKDAIMDILAIAPTGEEFPY